MDGRPRSAGRVARAGSAICAVVALCGLTAGPVDASGLTVSGRSITVVNGALDTTCTLDANASAAVVSDDTYTTEKTPTSNFATATTLQVASKFNGVGSAANDRAYTYLRFDLSSCAIPSAATVVSATLQLTASTVAASRTFGAYRITSAWTEATTTWSASPTVLGSATGTAATATTMQWGVGTDVQAFVNGTAVNRGWLVRDEVADTPNNRTTFASKSGTVGSRPVLTIRYR